MEYLMDMAIFGGKMVDTLGSGKMAWNVAKGVNWL